jgi:hypothetical protein
MTGTIINVIAVLLGGALGLLFGARLPERLKATVIAGLGSSLPPSACRCSQTENPLIVLGALLTGALLDSGGGSKTGCTLWDGFSKCASHPAFGSRDRSETATDTQSNSKGTLRGF